MDMWEDWGESLIESIWIWDQGCTPPLCFIVKFLLSSFEWIALATASNFEAQAIKQQMNTDEIFDWSRKCHPALDVLVVGYPDGSIECVIYFVWMWDASDSTDVTKAAHPDDAKVDLRLWNVGGDGPRMEEARGQMRDGLHQSWRR